MKTNLAVIFRPQTEKLNCRTFFKLSFGPKISGKNVCHFEEKIENYFFFPLGGASELKSQPFDSESKTTSGFS